MKVVVSHLWAGSGIQKEPGNPRPRQQWGSRRAWHGGQHPSPRTSLTVRPTHAQGLEQAGGCSNLILGLRESSTIPRWENPTEAPTSEILPFSLKPACKIILTSPSSSFGSWC